MFVSPQDTQAAEERQAVNECFDRLVSILEQVIDEPTLLIIPVLNQVLLDFVFRKKEENFQHDEHNNAYRHLVTFEYITPALRNLIIRTVVMILHIIDHPKYISDYHHAIYLETSNLNYYLDDLFNSNRIDYMSDDDIDSWNYMHNLFHDVLTSIYTSSVYYNNVCEEAQPLMSNLATENLLNESPEDCAICLDQFPKPCSDFAILPGCGHKFCDGCIRKWIKEK